MTQLNNREKVVLQLRKEGKTLEQIGKMLNITKERVRQIEKKAECKLEHSLTSAKALGRLAENFTLSYEDSQMYYVSQFADDVACIDNDLHILTLLKQKKPDIELIGLSSSYKEFNTVERGYRLNSDLFLTESEFKLIKEWLKDER